MANPPLVGFGNVHLSRTISRGNNQTDDIGLGTFEVFQKGSGSMLYGRFIINKTIMFEAVRGSKGGLD